MRALMTLICLGLAVFCPFAGSRVVQAQPSDSTAAKPDPWGPWQFLVGNWVGGGEGAPGQGMGAFDFTPDLQNKILVRHSHADYPASAGRPATVHDDLLIVYAPTDSGTARAIYFDNEGHTINYTAGFSADAKKLSFVSDPAPGPRFRLTYEKTAADTLGISFDIAPPKNPDSFSTYVAGKAWRKR
jgi:hypothetical protein